MQNGEWMENVKLQEEVKPCQTRNNFMTADAQGCARSGRKPRSGRPVNRADPPLLTVVTIEETAQTTQNRAFFATASTSRR